MNIEENSADIQVSERLEESTGICQSLFCSEEWVKRLCSYLPSWDQLRLLAAVSVKIASLALNLFHFFPLVSSPMLITSLDF